MRTLTAVLAIGMFLAGCGNDSEKPPGEPATKSPSITSPSEAAEETSAIEHEDAEKVLRSAVKAMATAPVVGFAADLVVGSKTFVSTQGGW